MKQFLRRAFEPTNPNERSGTMQTFELPINTELIDKFKEIDDLSFEFKEKEDKMTTEKWENYLTLNGYPRFCFSEPLVNINSMHFLEKCKKNNGNECNSLIFIDAEQGTRIHKAYLQNPSIAFVFKSHYCLYSVKSPKENTPMIKGNNIICTFEYSNDNLWVPHINQDSLPSYLTMKHTQNSINIFDNIQPIKNSKLIGVIGSAKSHIGDCKINKDHKNIPHIALIETKTDNNILYLYLPDDSPPSTPFYKDVVLYSYRLMQQLCGRTVVFPSETLKTAANIVDFYSRTNDERMIFGNNNTYVVVRKTNAEDEFFISNIDELNTWIDSLSLYYNVTQEIIEDEFNNKSESGKLYEKKDPKNIVRRNKAKICVEKEGKLADDDEKRKIELITSQGNSEKQNTIEFKVNTKESICHTYDYIFYDIKSFDERTGVHAKTQEIAKLKIPGVLSLENAWRLKDYQKIIVLLKSVDNVVGCYIIDYGFNCNVLPKPIFTTKVPPSPIKYSFTYSLQEQTIYMLAPIEQSTEKYFIYPIKINEEFNDIEDIDHIYNCRKISYLDSFIANESNSNLCIAKYGSDIIHLHVFDSKDESSKPTIIPLRNNFIDVSCVNLISFNNNKIIITVSGLMEKERRETCTFKIDLDNSNKECSIKTNQSVSYVNIEKQVGFIFFDKKGRLIRDIKGKEEIILPQVDEEFAARLHIESLRRFGIGSTCLKFCEKSGVPLEFATCNLIVKKEENILKVAEILGSMEYSIPLVVIPQYKFKECSNYLHLIQSKTMPYASKFMCQLYLYGMQRIYTLRQNKPTEFYEISPNPIPYIMKHTHFYSVVCTDLTDTGIGAQILSSLSYQPMMNIPQNSISVAYSACYASSKTLAQASILIRTEFNAALALHTALQHANTIIMCINNITEVTLALDTISAQTFEKKFKVYLIGKFNSKSDTEMTTLNKKIEEVNLTEKIRFILIQESEPAEIASFITKNEDIGLISHPYDEINIRALISEYTSLVYEFENEVSQKDE